MKPGSVHIIQYFIWLIVFTIVLCQREVGVQLVNQRIGTGVLQILDHLKETLFVACILPACATCLHIQCAACAKFVPG